MMSWITPFLTWANNMVLSKTPFHRIENNIAYLAELLG